MTGQLLSRGCFRAWSLHISLCPPCVPGPCPTILSNPPKVRACGFLTTEPSFLHDGLSGTVPPPGPSAPGDPTGHSAKKQVWMSRNVCMYFQKRSFLKSTCWKSYLGKIHSDLTRGERCGTRPRPSTGPAAPSSSAMRVSQSVGITCALMWRDGGSAASGCLGLRPELLRQH